MVQERKWIVSWNNFQKRKSKCRAMERKKVAIVGIGLIGGSLALQLNEKGIAAGLIGVEANLDHAQQSLDLHLVLLYQR